MEYFAYENNQKHEAFQSLKSIISPAVSGSIQNLDSFVERILKNGPLSIYPAKQHFQDFEGIYQKIIEDKKYQTYRKQVQTNINEPKSLLDITPNPKCVNHFFSANYLPTLQTKEFISSLHQDKSNTPSDLPTLFGSLIPLILDLLERREDLFHGFILALHNLDCEFGIPFKNLMRHLEVKDLLALLLESCPPFFVSKLHMCLMNSLYPFPLVYPLRTGQHQSNFSLCSHLMFQVNKPLILSAGTKSTQNLGKSSLLFETFGTQKPGLFSTANGLTHSGSIDLYMRIPNEMNQFLIADVHCGKGDEEIEEFSNLVSEVAAISQLIIFHFTAKDVKIKDDNKYYIDTELYLPNHVLYLFRDYEETNKQTLLNLQESLKDSVGIIPIPKLNSAEKTPAAIVSEKKIIQEILQKITNFSMIPQNTLFQNQLEEIQKHLRNPLIKTEKLFSSLTLDCKILQTEKSQKKMSMFLHGGLSDEQKQENLVKMQQIQNQLLHLKSKKFNSKLNALLESILQVISQPDSLQHLQLKQIIQNFKKTLPLALNENSSQFPQDIDIQLPTFIDDGISFFESNLKEEAFSQQYQSLKRYLKYCLKHNNPVGLLNGTTLKYGNKLLKEVLGDENDKEKVFVISVIGEQNSAKSTLLNALFASGFTVASGRCTRGLDFALLRHPSGFKIIVIDTEGLLSIQARDHEFDNLITTMIFSCSHIVIVNIKGELNRLHKNLIELCCYAMHYLKLNDEVRPKLIFALRDVADYGHQQSQKNAFDHLKKSLEEAAKKDLIDINGILDFDENDLFLLPSALIRSSQNNENGGLFASQIMKMRSYIFEYLLKKTLCAMPSLDYFYNHTTNLWETLTEVGKRIMQAKNVHEFELMNEAFETVIEISRTHSQIFLNKGNELLSFFKTQEFDEKYNFKDPLLSSYMETKNSAFQDLDEQILKNLKYADISSEFNELKNLLQFKLKGQKQQLKNEWKNFIFEKKYQLKLKKSQKEIKLEINEVIRTSDLNNVEFKVNHILQSLKKKLETEFQNNRKTLESSLARLPQEIYNNFQYLIQKVNKINHHSTKIPTLNYQDCLSKLQAGQAENPNIESLLKLSINNSHENNEKVLEIIAKFFKKFLKKIDGIIHSKITEESINSSISLCLSTMSEMEREKIPVNSPLFLSNGMIAAMSKQYKKVEQAKLTEMEEKRQAFSQVLAEEENLITEFLKKSQDLQGEKSATYWWRKIKEEFFKEEACQMEMNISEKLSQKSIDPETLLKEAYSQSFQKRDFKNVVKYVLDLNKFIKETHSEIINKLISYELTKEISQQRAQDFIRIIQSLIKALEEWKDKEKNAHKVKLGNLLLHISNGSNESLKRLFPDLYHIDIYNLEYFVSGCVNRLTDLLDENLEEKFGFLLLKELKRIFRQQSANLEGCQMRCETCHGKCQIPGSSHLTHFTNCQLILAFHGKCENETNNAILASCLQTINEEVNEISLEQKECWVGTKDFFVKHYGYKENTPEDWLDLVKPEARLKSHTVIHGYSDK